MRYAFADSAAAVCRPRLVAAVFARSTTTFLAAAVDARRARSASTLYVGGRLAALGDAGALHARSSAVARLPVADRRAAAMFALTLRARDDDPDPWAHHGEDGLARLGVILRATAEGADDESTITGGLRQIVLERT